MKRIAKVIDLSGDKAVLEMFKASHCGRCNKDCLSCKGAKRVQFTVNNTLSAQRDDFVEIDADLNNLLKISFAIYILPLAAALVVGIAVCAAGLTGAWPVLTGVVAGLVAFCALHLYSRKIDRQGLELSKMISIIEKNQQDVENRSGK
jgi:positive regulator of sigma E activity